MKNCRVIGEGTGLSQIAMEVAMEAGLVIATVDDTAIVIAREAVVAMRDLRLERQPQTL